MGWLHRVGALGSGSTKMVRKIFAASAAPTGNQWVAVATRLARGLRISCGTACLPFTPSPFTAPRFLPHADPRLARRRTSPRENGRARGQRAFGRRVAGGLPRLGPAPRDRRRHQRRRDRDPRRPPARRPHRDLRHRQLRKRRPQSISRIAATRRPISRWFRRLHRRGTCFLSGIPSSSA